MKQTTKKPELKELRLAAADAEVDLRTLERALAGAKVRRLALERIRRALNARGMSDLLPEVG